MWFTQEAKRRERNIPSAAPHRLEDSGEIDPVVASKANGKRKTSRRNGARAN